MEGKALTAGFLHPSAFILRPAPLPRPLPGVPGRGSKGGRARGGVRNTRSETALAVRSGRAVTLSGVSVCIRDNIILSAARDDVTDAVIDLGGLLIAPTRRAWTTPGPRPRRAIRTQ